LSPPNGSYTGSYHAAATYPAIVRPTFSWLNPCSSTGATFDLQVDDSCATVASCTFPDPEINLTDLSDAFYTPAANLAVSSVAPVGRRYYWHVRVCTSVGTCGPWSPTHYLDVGRVRNDFNGDGYSDIAVGMPYYDTAMHPDVGRVYVFPGASGGLSSTPLAVLTSSSGEDYSWFGTSLASGDLDGDGYADLAVGEPQWFGGTAADGQVRVFRGATLAGATPPSINIPCPTGEAAGYFGQALAALGDVNGDGYADLAVGQPYHTASLIGEAGRVYIYHGSASLTLATVNTTLDPPTPQGSARFGWRLAWGLGLDSDGYADLLVGAPFEDRPALNEGVVYKFSGSATGLIATSVTVADNPANQANGNFGFSIAWTGDVDGDGQGNVVIGAVNQSNGASGEGNVFDFDSAWIGATASPTTTIDCPGNESGARFGFSVGGLDSLVGVGDGMIVGAATYDDATWLGGEAFFHADNATAPTRTFFNPVSEADAYFGMAVAGAGDVNGDGVPDMIVGSPYVNTAGTGDAGQAYVYWTGASTPNLFLPPPDLQLNAQFGYAVL
jgi:hypothetical protein